MPAAGDESILVCPACGLRAAAAPVQSGETRRCARCSAAIDEHTCATVVGTLADASRPPAPVLDGSYERFGKYLLLQEAGRGAMGVVYRAMEPALRRAVALKVLRTERPVTATLPESPTAVEELQRFLREARTTACLRHPNIVQVHEVGEVEGHHYIAMEWVEGGSLRDRFRAGRGATQTPQWLRWLADIARAVEYAHGQGVIHRDLKPENILIKVEGTGADRVCTPMVADFGLARRVQEETQITRTGQVMGTPSYMSPEQCDGTTGIDGRSDVFALGCILYEFLAWRKAFDGPNPLGIMYAVLQEEPIPLRKLAPAVTSDLETVVERAMEKDPTRRYASAGALADELERVLRGEPVLARPASTVTRLARKAMKHPAALAGTAVVIALLATFAVYVDGVRSQRKAAKEASARRDADAQAAARRLLEKAALVQDVLARWVPLVDALRELERNFHNDGLTEARIRERGARSWQVIDEFMQGTPADPASQSVMKALAGWARRLAGYPEEALKWMREARELDPDLPYGPLMEAISCFWEYLARQPMAAFTTEGAAGLKFWGLPEESAEMKAIRVHMEELLAQAEAAPVWGEKRAREFRHVLDAMRALQAGRYEDADRELTAAIGGANVQVFQGELLFARAKVRCLLRRFPEGLEDMAKVTEAWPDLTAAYLYIGLQELGAAEVASRANGDSMPHFEKAVRALGEIIRRFPRDADAFAILGTTYSRRGIALGQRGEDTRESSDLAIRNYDRALALNGDRNDVRFNRANGLLRRGSLREQEDEDAREDFARALADMDVVIALAPGFHKHWFSRGLVQERLAVVAGRDGRDPLEAYEKSLADFDKAIELMPADAEIHHERAGVRLAISDVGVALGKDMGVDDGRILADLEKALQIAPETPGVRDALEGLQREMDPAFPVWARTSRRGNRSITLGAYARAGMLYEQALKGESEAGLAPAVRRALLLDARYNLACIDALRSAGRAGPLAAAQPVAPEGAARWRDAAFAHLEAAVGLGYADGKHLAEDPDLIPLHEDPRWAGIRDRLLKVR